MTMPSDRRDAAGARDMVVPLRDWCRANGITGPSGIPDSVLHELANVVLATLAQQADGETERLVEEYGRWAIADDYTEAARTAKAALLAHVASLRDQAKVGAREIEDVRMAERYLGGRGVIRLTGDELSPRRTLSEMIVRLEDKVRAETIRAERTSLRAAPPTGEEETDEMHAVALEVLCRVFADGADKGIQEFMDWYQPTAWWHWSRALGAFIYTRLEAERAALAARADKAEASVRRLTAEDRERERQQREDYPQAQAEVARLTDALREIEAHHVESNQRKGRDESRSETLRIARAALKGSIP